MGQYFIGSKAGDDARYQQKEQRLANSLPAPPEFAQPISPKQIPKPWLLSTLNHLFKLHLGFEDEITEAMIAESLTRGDQPREILVMVTALSSDRKSAFNLLQSLWQKVLAGEYKNSKVDEHDGNGKDEITLLREKVVANVLRRQMARSPGRDDRRRHYRNDRNYDDRHYRAPPRPSRSPPTTTTRPSSPPRPSINDWDRVLREKAWQAANSSIK